MVGHSEALYYPCTEYPTDAWLKTACLYWDKIHTIVPAQHRAPYAGHAAIALAERNILVPLRVRSDMPELNAIGDEVTAFLKTPVARSILRPHAAAGVIRSAKRPRKIAKLLSIGALRKTVANASPDAIERMMQVDGGLADYYNTLVAERFAERRGLAMVSDEDECRALAQHAYFESTVGRPHNPVQLGRRKGEGIVANLVIDTIGISDRAAIDDILAFKGEHQAELSRLRNRVSELTSALQDCTTTDAVRARAADIANGDITPALARLHGAIRASAWREGPHTLLGIACFSVATPSLLASLISSPIHGLMIGAGITLGVGIVKYRKSKQQILADNPYSFLLRARALRNHNPG